MKHLAKKLSNKVGLNKVPFEKFNHVDFIWAEEAYKLVYKRVVEALKRFEPIADYMKTKEAEEMKKSRKYNP